MRIAQDDEEVRNPQLLAPLLFIAVASPIVALAQAVLAGQGWFEDHDYFDIHEVVANLFFLLVIGQLVLTALAGVPGSLGRRIVAINGVLILLTVVQIGLGYEGRDGSGQALAWHVPNGVLIFGIGVALAFMVQRLRTST